MAARDKDRQRMKHIICDNCGTFYETRHPACIVCDRPTPLLRSAEKKFKKRSYSQRSFKTKLHRGEYVSWTAMKSRCLNEDSEAYPKYGGRGITICDQWITSFDCFLADMGPRPDGYTLERKDNNGNYEPANCIWATRATQNRNKGNTRHIEFRGETKLLADWCREFGLNPQTASRRLECGWSVLDTFTKATQTRRSTRSSSKAMG